MNYYNLTGFPMTTTHVKDQHFAFPGGQQPSAEKLSLKRKPS